jgi:hypothetical protein
MLLLRLASGFNLSDDDHRAPCVEPATAGDRPVQAAPRARITRAMHHAAETEARVGTSGLQLAS